MSIIPIDKAKTIFSQYVSNYDAEDDRIKLKTKHTYHVVDRSKDVAESLNLSKEYVELSMLIGLLHDIGRFEQVKLHNTFDDTIFPHSDYGIKVLFEDNHIRDYIKEDKYDDIIYNAIKYHSDFKLDETKLDGKLLLHSKLIRDADKLDIFRVILEENMRIISSISREQLEKSYIADEVYSDLIKCKGVLRSKRNTSIDVIATFIGFVFDINYKFSFEYVLENKYIEKIVKNIEFINNETKEKILNIQKVTEKYMIDKIKE